MADSPLLAALRKTWLATAPSDAKKVTVWVEQAQRALWKFNTVGHIGREGGPTRWMEFVSTVTSEQPVRLPLPTGDDGREVTIFLAASDLGEGDKQNVVVWANPRIEFKDDGPSAGHPPIALRDLRQLTAGVELAQQREMNRVAAYLAALAELAGSTDVSIDELAKSNGLDSSLLANWSKFTGVGQPFSREITGLFTEQIKAVQGYATVNGWGNPGTPSLLTNQAADAITFSTITVPGRGVTVHPSPTLDSLVGWKSPIAGRLRVEGLVADMDGNCGNGYAWRVELRSATGITELASGVVENGRAAEIKPTDEIDVAVDDVVALVVAAHNKDHVCDTTQVDLALSEVGGDGRTWQLARDIVDRVLEGNPLPDGHGHEAVWHFGAVEGDPSATSDIPAGSALERWRQAVVGDTSTGDVAALVQEVERILTSPSADGLSDADKQLRQRLLAWTGPLGWTGSGRGAAEANGSEIGLDPDSFGTAPNGAAVEPTDYCIQAPQVVEVRIPGELAGGAVFAARCRIAAAPNDATAQQKQVGAVQVHVGSARPEVLSLSPSAPLLVAAGSDAETQLRAAVEEFANLFPPALCYARIVPVDEVVTMNLMYCEDDHLRRLMLDDAESAKLDRLWDELRFVNQEPLKMVDTFEQVSAFFTQDRPDLVEAYAPQRKRIAERAEQFRQLQVSSEPWHVDALLAFADRAWRRPLGDDEKQRLRQSYQTLRSEDVPHEEAVRIMLARVLTSPSFLYKLEQPSATEEAMPVSNHELATRLSYFLWSSTPDEELRTVADAGRLVPDVSDDAIGSDTELIRQTRRMLADPRIRRLAIHFACQWLHLRDFDQNDDKNEKLYPEFAELRGAMYEETVRYFDDMFRHNGSILDIVDADHTLLNDALAKHYGIAGVDGSQWWRVSDVRAQGRGGVLGMATFLASQSGASRTSPILRGNWIYETLLGERLPRPPANVPQLPDEVPSGLTERELIEQHSSVKACAKCHVKIDPYGFALEQYDAIGRLRANSVDTSTTLADGTLIEGIDGLRRYLLEERRDDVVRQFCRKLLGYALGREVQLSDELLLDQMAENLAEDDYRFHTAVETIVRSKQFRYISG